jgi:hypothetical protein
VVNCFGSFREEFVKFGEVSSMPKTAGLGAAHEGYFYQDLATAYFLAEGLVRQVERITVDRKEYEGDMFDDLTVRDGSRVVRRQFKYREHVDRKLQVRDFTTQVSRLRIDDVVRCYKRAGDSPADEYRICTRWAKPEDTDLADLLVPSDAAPSFGGYQSQLFCLRADLIWPPNEEPIWGPLRDSRDFSRADFLAFAERLVIELECPGMSQDPFNPGPLEDLLLHILEERIGVGRWPNQDLRAEDAALRLIVRATDARTHGETLTCHDIEAALHIRTDFGRVTQQFPLDRRQLVNREAFRSSLRKSILAGQTVILTGLPGSGKSWTLTDLAEHLASKGHLVARHYCFLEPGDPEVARRIITGTVFGNLVAELLDADAALRTGDRPRYSAGSEELRSIASAALKANPERKVVLIVDGLDHIARVLRETPEVAPQDTSIVEELALLDLPEGACLVVGSQPGSHLQPLLASEHSRSVELPPWTREETEELAQRLGVVEALQTGGLKGTQADLLASLHERSEGNPLYATFLSRQVLAGLSGREAIDPVSLVRQAPVIQGEISNYYDYLLRNASGEARIVAGLLGHIDFGLSEHELQEIFPNIAAHIPQALLHLSSVLARVSAQGGVRIYHESFRRFIVERRQAAGHRPRDILDPVIGWLSTRGFYKDTRAYRFLPSCLRRAGRKEELLALIGWDFVSKSVEQGHPRSAIRNNLAIGIDVAAEERSWQSLARLAELSRSLHTCFEEKLLDFDLYGRAYMSLFKAHSLAERLLFDGRPTMGRNQGLLLCSFCDDVGVTPPWREYLALPSESQEREGWEPYALAEFHGALRVRGVKKMGESLVGWLNRVSEPSVRYLRGMLERLGRAGGQKAIEAVLEATNAPDETRALIRTELARAHHAAGDRARAARVATEAVAQSKSAELAFECLGLGAEPAEVAKRCPDLAHLNIGLGPNAYHADEAPVHAWVAGVGIMAMTDPAHLTALRQGIEGGGWYRAWLRFVIAVSEAEAQSGEHPDNAEAAVLRELGYLAEETNPFLGTPRACDLYQIREVVHSTFERAMRLLHGPASWELALKHLRVISRCTTTYLQKSPGGPLVAAELIRLLLPYAGDDKMDNLVVDTIAGLVEQAEEAGQFYEIQAEHEMLLVRALAARARQTEAQERWRKVSVFLAGYGWRKDVTIWELIDPLPALAAIDRKRALVAAARTQKLVYQVVDHTDGKETGHALNVWFGKLCRIDPVGALELIARSASQIGGRIDWRLESAFASAVDAAQQTGNPLILNSLQNTIPFQEQADEAERRLDVLGRLLAADRVRGHAALRLLEAQVQGDAKELDATAYDKVRQFGISHSIPVSPADPVLGGEGREDAQGSTEFGGKDRSEFGKILDGMPVFPINASPLAILSALRARPGHVDDRADHSRLVNALGFRIAELLQTGNEPDALRLLADFGRRQTFSSLAKPLASLAEGLERHGYAQPAALTFTLAYAHSRGRGGWDTLGGTEQHAWFERALTLSQETALETLASEIAFHLHEKHYTMGVTAQIVELSAKYILADVAFAAWEEAYGVIRHRLPGDVDLMGPFLPYDPDHTHALSLDEALVFLLLSRVSHPELGRKVAALSGIAEVVHVAPQMAVAGVKSLLRADTCFTTVVAVLHTILESEQPPYPLTAELRTDLECLLRTDDYVLSEIAYLLLQRAGVTPTRQRHQADMPLGRGLTAKRRRAVLSLDWGERTEKIRNGWPDFSVLITDEFDRAFESAQSHRQRSASRHEAAKSRVYQRLPPTPLLFWEQELFEVAFSKVLTGIDTHLWTTGAWTPQVHANIVEEVLPETPLQVAAWFSRTVRPKIPLPSQQCDASLVPTPISGGGDYDGWYRAGYLEYELLLNSGPVGDYSGTVQAASGLVFVAARSELDDIGIPFGRGSADRCWFPHEVAASSPIQRFEGPLIGLDWIEDFLGRRPVLMLPSKLAKRCSLALGPWPGRLELLDSNGRPAVVFRCWRLRPVGNEIAEAQPRLSGCDLIVRADVFESICALSDYGALEVRRTKRIEPRSQ